MKDGALRKVAELPPETRHAMENIIGRPLREDEAISINVYKPATGKAREEASRRLLERIEKTSEKVRGVPDEDIDAAIDDAADYVRTTLSENHSRHEYPCPHERQGDRPGPCSKTFLPAPTNLSSPSFCSTRRRACSATPGCTSCTN